MIKEALAELSQKHDLSYEMAAGVINEIMNGEASQGLTAAFLTALAMKGETVTEITACAAAMRAHALPVDCQGDLFEIVGTGGDRSNSFNISTTAAIIIASAGVKVAKHGNRAASSKSGATDCLEALGVNTELEPEKCAELYNTIGICYFHAQKYHTSMKYVGPVRKELGIRTVFNILGPLTNPGHANMQIMGVYDGSLVEPMAEVLSKLGVRRGMVVYGTDVLDEISLSAPTKVCEFTGDNREVYTIRPEDFGLKTCRKFELTGGTPKENAEITRSILRGERGPQREIVLMNAGAGLYIAGKADSMSEGIRLAAELIDSGTAQKKLEELIKYSNH